MLCSQDENPTFLQRPRVKLGCLPVPLWLSLASLSSWRRQAAFTVLSGGGDWKRVEVSLSSFCTAALPGRKNFRHALALQLKCRTALTNLLGLCLSVAYWICFVGSSRRVRGWTFWSMGFCCCRRDIRCSHEIWQEEAAQLQATGKSAASCDVCILFCNAFRWFQRPTSFQSWRYLKIIIFRCCVCVALACENMKFVGCI